MATRAARASDVENRHLQTEQLLADKGVKFTYMTGLSTNQIDLGKSQRNQARFQALDEDTVKRYVNDLANGSIFPPVIVYKPSKARSTRSKYVLVDGNHRAEAHQRAGRAVDAYVLNEDTRADTITILTYSCNTRHGLSMTEDERTEHALYLVFNNVPEKKAADEMNITLSVLRTARRRREIEDRAKVADIDPRTWDDLTTSVKGFLASITVDEVMKSAALLAHNAGMSAEQVRDMCNQLRGNSSISKQNATLKDLRVTYADQIADRKNGLVAARKTQTPKVRLGLAVGSVMAVNAENLRKYYGTEDEREEAAKKLREASARLNEIAENLTAG